MERKAAPNFSLAGSARRRLVANHHTESVITARYDAAEVQISVSRSDEWTKVCHSEEAQRADVGISSTEQSINDKPINIEHPRFSMLISFFCFPLRCRRLPRRMTSIRHAPRNDITARLRDKYHFTTHLPTSAWRRWRFFPDGTPGPEKCPDCLPPPSGSCRRKTAATGSAFPGHPDSGRRYAG